MTSFDLVIVGGGAAAFGAAIKASDLGAKAVMINAGLPLGGTCVNVGCVPSKTLLWAGEVLHLANRHGVPGIEFNVARFDFASVVGDELALVARMREEKYRRVLQHLEHVLGGVGLTEDEQMERLGVCACRTVSFADVPKAMIMKRTEGLIKMAIHPQSGEIMGGPRAPRGRTDRRSDDGGPEQEHD